MRALVALVVAIVIVAGSVGLTNEMQQPTDEAKQQSLRAPNMAVRGNDSVDDAAHFKYYQNNSDIYRWYEWWYLNVKTENGHSLLIEFFTFGNLNNPLTSAVGVVMIFMHKDGSTYRSLKSYPGIPYTLSYETCDVSIAGNQFIQRDDGSYDVSYQNYIQQVDLDLHITGLTAPIVGRHSKLNDKEWMAWNAAVPAGEVFGNLEFRDNSNIQQYNMTGVGYHDHNWGITRKIPLEWDWGEFTDPSLPITFIYGAAKVEGGPYEQGGINVATTTQDIYLPIQNVSIEYLEWEDVAGISKPTMLRITGESSTMTVQATVRLHRYYLVAGTGWFAVTYLVGSLNADISINGHHYEMRNVIGFYEHHYFSIFS